MFSLVLSKCLLRDLINKGQEWIKIYYHCLLKERRGQLDSLTFSSPLHSPCSYCIGYSELLTSDNSMSNFLCHPPQFHYTEGGIYVVGWESSTGAAWGYCRWPCANQHTSLSIKMCWGLGCVLEGISQTACYSRDSGCRTSHRSLSPCNIE